MDPTKRKPKRNTNYRLSDRGIELLALLAEHWGTTKTAVLEKIIREEAARVLPRSS